jgi:ABC-type phosphate transport system substrate-binding protein
VSDWNSVPKADGSGFVSAASLPIKICNRDQGSGTRASAAFYANNYLCGGPGLATTGGLAVNASTGTELTCISGNAGAIGYATYQGATNPAGTSLVTLNALTPSVINAATGQYEFWYEATFNNGAALTGLDSNLANALTARVRDAANLPAANVNGLALADFNTPVTPVVDPIRAVAITTHGGNSCNQTYTVF